MVRQTGVVLDDEIVQRIKDMRAKGARPKVIARALGMTPAAVAPLIRAAAESGDTPEPAGDIAGCWISPGWSDGLTVHGHPEWTDVDEPDKTISGIASVLVARRQRHSMKLRFAGYFVDTYCLGVKNAMGPDAMTEPALREFMADFFGTYDAEPLAAPLELACHLVFGAADYARGLGFEPHPDFAAAAEVLGPWHGPSDITFGRDGVPTFIRGPYDNAGALERTLEKAVGKGNYDVLEPF